MMKVLIKSAEEMGEFASSFVKEFITGKEKRESALVISLQGDLGAGKTTFTKAVARALGVEETVTSPTFVIEKIYKLPAGARFSHLIHIDAYRLDRGEELLSLGWRDIIADPRNLILVEWPERVAEIIPATAETLRFGFIDEHTREVEY